MNPEDEEVIHSLMAKMTVDTRDRIWNRLKHMDEFISQLEEHEEYMQSGNNPDDVLKHDAYLSVVSNLLQIKPIPSQQIDSFDRFMENLPHLLLDMAPVIWRRDQTLIMIHFGKLQILPPQKPLKGASKISADCQHRSKAASKLLSAIRHYEDTVQRTRGRGDGDNLYGIKDPITDDNCHLFDPHKSFLKEEKRSLSTLKEWVDTALLPNQAEREGWSYCSTGPPHTHARFYTHACTQRWTEYYWQIFTGN